MEPYSFAKEYYNETAATVELCRFAASAAKEIAGGGKEKAASMSESFFKDYYLPIDKESFVSVMGAFINDVPEESHPEYLKEELAKYGSVSGWADACSADRFSLMPKRSRSLRPRIPPPCTPTLR